MTPFVELQRTIISWLFRIIESTEGEEFVRRLVEEFLLLSREKVYMDDTFSLWRDLFSAQGLVIPSNQEGWDVDVDLVEIFLEQVDGSGPRLKIRNLLGMPLRNTVSTYDLGEWVDLRGRGDNRLRTERFAQPGALRPDDILATGEKVLSLPREGGNGEILIHLSGGEHGTWLGFPSRTALALLTSQDSPPIGLIEN